MSVIQVKRFGLVLTGRQYGKDATQAILKENLPPFVLDFAGVVSMGSSFADELLPALYDKQKPKALTVQNMNDVVNSCISKVIQDSGITIEAK